MSSRSIERDIAAALSDVIRMPAEGHPGRNVDAMVRAGDHVFVAECKSGAAADEVGGAIRELRVDAPPGRGVVPLVVVPYMGDVGKVLCRVEGVSWLDLSGNADITAPGLRIRIEGKPNRFKQRGRAKDLFATSSSRLARALLLSPGRAFSQKELADETHLNPGDISRLARRYEEAGFITREPSGRKWLIRLTGFDLLLSAWYQANDFSVHSVRRGHIPSPSGMALLKELSEAFAREGIDYAATGLAGAWLQAPFATFRLVTVYVRDWPPADVLAGMGYREGPRGSNVWLVQPRDEAVFERGGVVKGIRHVSALQCYLDLKAQPERSDEAAEEVRRLLVGEERNA